MICLEFKIGDLVTRNSYNNDMIFKILSIDDGICYLKGIDVRLVADSPIDDLSLYENELPRDDDFYKKLRSSFSLDRSDFFYLPGKILHIDADNDYLEKCINFYKYDNLCAVGICESEDSIKYKVYDLLELYNPNILVITGHDAYYKKKGDKNDLNAYKNSRNFVDAILEARRFERSHEKLIIIAGACQSDYEELIRAGANFASSPKHINIHALDPAIVAASISLSDVNKDIDLLNILNNTKYGHDGIGGIKTKGTMYIGYPR